MICMRVILRQLWLLLTICAVAFGSVAAAHARGSQQMLVDICGDQIGGSVLVDVTDPDAPKPTHICPDCVMSYVSDAPSLIGITRTTLITPAYFADPAQSLVQQARLTILRSRGPPNFLV